MRIVQLDNDFYEVEDYRSKVRPFLSSIDNIGFSLLEDEIIQRKFLERLIAYEEAINAKGIFQGATCLFDLVFDAINEDKRAKALLCFINECIINVQSGLNQELYLKFKPTLLDLFINFESSGSQSHYLSRIGEIAVLDRFLSRQIIVTDIEYKLLNGKRIDFAVRLKDSDERTFIEVDNIHLKMDKVNSIHELQQFLERRFLDKINNKLGGLDKAFLKQFSLFPVFWGALEDFEEYNEIFDWMKEMKPALAPAYGIYFMGLRDGSERYIFEVIDNVRKKKSRRITG